MALPDPIPRREIVLDVTSAAVDYEIPFPFIFDMDIEIAVSTPALPNTFSRLTYPTGYTLTGAGAPIGGAVHLTAAPQVGAKIRVRGISAENASEDVVRGVRYNYISIEQSLLRLGWGLQEAVRDLSDIGDIVDGVRDAVEQTTANAATASAAAAAAAASAVAAALWDPSSYSTTAQITAMLAGYAPASSGVPIGMVAGFDLDLPPAGWIVGDGSAINRAAYPALDAAKYCGDANNATATAWYRCSDPANPSGSRSINGAYLVTRDLRDYFPRFAGVGRVVGSYQDGQNASHTHGVTDPGHAHGVSDPGHSHSVFDPKYNANGSNQGRQSSAGDGGYTNTSGAVTGVSIQGATTGVSIQSSGGAEARPKNIALLGCIKAY